MSKKPRSLAEYLRYTGTTQSELAARVGVKQSAISRIASGGRRPSLALALRIAAATKIPIESLVSRGEAA